MLAITKVLHYFNAKPETYYLNIDAYPEILVSTLPRDGYVKVDIPQELSQTHKIKNFRVNHDIIAPHSISYANILGRDWTPFDGFECDYSFAFGNATLHFSTYFTKLGELSYKPEHSTNVQEFIEQKAVILRHEQEMQSLLKKYNIVQQHNNVFVQQDLMDEPISLETFLSQIINPTNLSFSP